MGGTILRFLSRETRPISYGLQLTVTVGRLVGWSVGWSVRHTFVFSMRTAFTAPAKLITAPAQPPATGVAVYTALFF